jgi:hypothetical protein
MLRKGSRIIRMLGCLRGRKGEPRPKTIYVKLDAGDIRNIFRTENNTQRFLNWLKHSVGYALDQDCGVLEFIPEVRTLKMHINPAYPKKRSHPGVQREIRHLLKVYGMNRDDWNLKVTFNPDQLICTKRGSL